MLAKSKLLILLDPLLDRRFDGVRRGNSWSLGFSSKNLWFWKLETAARLVATPNAEVGQIRRRNQHWRG